MTNGDHWRPERVWQLSRVLLACEELSITKDHDNILVFEHFLPVGHITVFVMNWKHPRNETTAMAKQEEANSGTRWSFIAALTAAA